MIVIKQGILLLLILFSLFFKEGNCLPNQQYPCYEFVCGSQASFLCASDGRTYLNGCVYSQAQCKHPGLYVVTHGPCMKEIAGSQKQEELGTIVPILGIEDILGTTDTSHTSTLEPVTTTVKFCSETLCPNNYIPVCGSNGITFKNLCQFRKAQCQSPELELKHEGRCKDHENCLSQICPMNEDPVCGSDGITYRNLCELSMAKCYNPGLSPASNGTCSTQGATPETTQCGSELQCNDDYRPLCATNGQTYPNICHFEKAKCLNAKLKIYKFAPC